MIPKQTTHECLNCKGGLLDHDMKNETYICPKCGAIYDRLTYLTAINTGNIPPIKEKVNFIEVAKVGTYADKTGTFADKTGTFAEDVKQGGNNMAGKKTGTCNICGKEDVELKWGRCAECKGKKPVKEPGKRGRKRKPSEISKIYAETAKKETMNANDFTPLRSHQQHEQPGQQVVPVKIRLDIEINVKVRVDKE